MGAKTTLTAQNLEALGAERLAGLLIDISTGNAALKRRLRLELAGVSSPREVARAIRKRLLVIDRSRAFVPWQSRGGLVDDLQAQHRAIVDHLAQADPVEALDLLWRFVALANGVCARCDDSGDAVIRVFHDAVATLGRIAPMARAHPHDLAGQIVPALMQNGYGQYDGLIAALGPALGAEGMAHLKQRMLEIGQEPSPLIAEADRQTIGWSSAGAIYAHDIEHASRQSAARHALSEIADAQGDPDGFIAQHNATARKMPMIAAKIATRLLAAGRADEAWQALEAVEQVHDKWLAFEWADARIAVLDALGRTADAQGERWSCFERALSARHLRDYLTRLADFDDVEAEQRAFDHAMTSTAFLNALAFLVAWPALERAAGLVLTRAKELDGDRYDILVDAAAALAGRYPLAATLILRAMVDFALETAHARRYRHAARHLAECTALAASIRDFGDFVPHDTYLAGLRQAHANKPAFWALMG